jgi:Ca-activated chloride channel family protein
MTFDAPWLLGTLLLVPLAAIAYWTLQRRPSRYAVAYSNLDVLAAVVGTRRAWRRHVPAALLLAALAAACLAMARPHVVTLRPSERASVVLVIDVSGSMRATDVEPTRLAAAQDAIRTFTEKVPQQLRVGLVAFSDDAQVVVPPSRDREQLRRGVDLLVPGFGTAIGDAIARAVVVGRASAAETGAAVGQDGAPAADGESEAPVDPTQAGPPVVDEDGKPLASIVMLSDGSQTRGVLTPGQGADLARRAQVPVFTVALGTDAGTIEAGPPGQRQTVPVPPDRETLAAIAEYTGGSFYDAESADALDDVYARLGSKVGREETPLEISSAFVALAAVLVAGALGGALLVAPRLP